MSIQSRGSITGRLTLLLVAATTVLWIVAALAASAFLGHELNESYDGALVEAAQRLLPLTLDSVQDSDTPDLHERHHFETDHDRRLPYQLLDPQGQVVLRSDDAPMQPFDTARQPGFSDSGDYRVFTLLDPNGGGSSIEVGEPLGARRQTILLSTLTLLVPLLVLLPLGGLGIGVAVRRGLSPLTVLQREIAARGSTNLAPLSIDRLPRELTPIATALESLIDRLRQALEAERQFAANSAHELRTPIAGALAQTQRLIENTADEQARSDARKIEATLKRLAELAEKLMQLARAEAGMAASAAPVAVLPVLRLVVEDAQSRARPPRDISLTVAAGAEAMSARINVDALGIVLRNLIDNALAHSAPETRVEVAVPRRGTIVVINATPTIPPDDLRRLRQRFERGATRASGSGLGLAIVETMLAQVGGTLTLRSPATGRSDGFEATVSLPGVD